MKTLVLSVALLSTVSLAGAVELMPTAFSSSRYQSMIDKSPFSLGTPPPAAVAPPAPAAPTFTQDLYLVGLAKLGNQDFVSIASKDQTQRFSILVGEQGPDGITVASVAREPGLAKSKVTLKKGTEFGTITFDEAAQNNTAVPGAPPPGQPPRPPGMQQPPNMIRPARPGYQQPTSANRMPMNRPVVPNVRPFRQGVTQPNLPQSRIRRPVIPSPR